MRIESWQDTGRFDNSYIISVLYRPTAVNVCMGAAACIPVKVTKTLADRDTIICSDGVQYIG